MIASATSHTKEGGKWHVEAKKAYDKYTSMIHNKKEVKAKPKRVVPVAPPTR